MRRPVKVTRAQMIETWRQTPLTFEPNLGQIDEEVKFVGRGAGFSVFLTANETILAASRGRGSAVVRAKMAGGDATAKPEAIGLLQGKRNYFIGNDPRQWRIKVPTYSQVQYRDIYPGVDLVYYGRGPKLEYDLVVHPGADPRTIRLAFEGASAISIDARGDLVLDAGAIEFRQHKPRIFQNASGAKIEIAGRYTLRGPYEVGFEVGSYDKASPLIIDPVMSYSTYLGSDGGDDEGWAVTSDSSGFAYITGSTCSFDFPLSSNAFQSKLGDILSCNAFVTKLDLTASGAQGLVYSTLLGGVGSETGFGITANADGNAFIIGNTTSTNFPTTSGAFQSKSGGRADVFVTELNGDGSALLYSTYYGGSGSDLPAGIALDSSGAVYITGETRSSDLPVAPAGSVFQDKLSGTGDAFLAKFDPSMSGTASLVYSTYFGGAGEDSAQAITVDADGRAYIAGGTDSKDLPRAGNSVFQTSLRGESDAFVAKFALDGTSVEYSTYLGGTGIDGANALALGGDGTCYVAGYTESADLMPASRQAVSSYKGDGDAFIAKLTCSKPADDQPGSDLISFTYLGGSDFEEALTIAVDSSSKIYVAGRTASSDYPVTADTFQSTFAGGVATRNEDPTDAFLTILNDKFERVFSTFIGGKRNDVAWGLVLNKTGDVYVAGITRSSDFPTTDDSFKPKHMVLPNFPDKDAFLVKASP